MRMATITLQSRYRHPMKVQMTLNEGKNKNQMMRMVQGMTNVFTQVEKQENQGGESQVKLVVKKSLADDG